MTYKELMDAARPHLGEICKGCYVCNGRACGNRMPGPGAKGNGDVAVRNYEKWQEVRINMDCLVKSVILPFRCSEKPTGIRSLRGRSEPYSFIMERN